MRQGRRETQRNSNHALRTDCKTSECPRGENSTEKGTDISEKPLRASKIVLIAAFIVLELFPFYRP